MKKLLAIATFVVAGAGAAGVGASSAITNEKGSDTLFQVTTDAIVAAGLTPAQLTYIGTGSGNGETAMINTQNGVAGSLQSIAPMSRFMAANVCPSANGGKVTTAGYTAANAQGLVVGLDGVAILAGVANTATCDGTANHCTQIANSGTALNTSVAVPASPNTAVAAYTYTFQSWRDVLAVVYGGLSNGQNTADTGCNSNIRNALVSNWTTLFQNPACASGLCPNGEAITTGTATRGSQGGVASPAGGTLTACTTAAPCTCTAASPCFPPQLQHAWRRDDASGTSDIVGTLLGLSPSASDSANANQGTSPFCNVLGGIVPGSGSPGFSQGNTTTQVRYGGSPVGQVSAATTAGTNDYIPTSYQDNDPIRHICVNSSRTDFEQVCDLDGKLGLILPIVPTDFLPTIAQQFPTAACNGSSQLAQAAPLFPNPNGRNNVNGRCPNGDLPGGTLCWVPAIGDGSLGTANFGCLNKHTNKPPALGNGGPVVGPACSTVTDCTAAPYAHPPTGNTAVCQQTAAGPPAVSTCDLTCTVTTGAAAVPGDCSALGSPVGGSITNYNCYASNGLAVSATNPGVCRIDPAVVDGRVFNKHLYTPSVGAGASATYQNDSFPRPIVGAFYRIHSIAALGAVPADQNGNAQFCTQHDATDQIGCLVTASPCSVGYAGRTADQWNGTASDGNQALFINEVPDATECVQNFDYPISRKLYLDTITGYNTSGVTGDELTLASFEAAQGATTGFPTHMDVLMNRWHFVELPNTATGETFSIFNGTYCEDYNEAMLCKLTSNNNACAGNAASWPVPAANSTTCGDGNIDPYEDCDDGNSSVVPSTVHNVGNGATGSQCSTTCRWTGNPLAADPGSCTAFPALGTKGTVACTRTASPIPTNATNGVCVTRLDGSHSCDP
jgi:hypothetical protein